MWRFCVRVFVFLLFSSALFSSVDFEKICNAEVLKEDFNVSVVQEACLKTAEAYDRESNIADASGYYFLADKQDKNIKYSKETPKDASGIYSNIGHSYMLSNDLKKGEEYYKKFILSYHNPNSPMQNDFKEFLRIYPKYKIQITKAKKIWDKLYEPLHGLDTLYNNLEYLEPSKKSITLLKQIIAIKEQHLENSLSLTSDYQSLAIVLEEQFSLYDKALYFYEKMLDIYLKLLGENYFDTATTYYNMANIYNIQGKYSKALIFFNKALKIDLKIFGEKHSETAATYHNIATVYVKIGQYKKALKLYEKSLVIDFEVLEDKEHEHIVATYHEMANLLNIQGKYDDALALYFRILEIDLKQKNSKKIELATLYHNIANTFKDKGEYHKSLTYYDKSLQITMKFLGEHHASTITTLHNIAFVHHYLGDYEKALKIYMKVLEIDLEIFGLEHPHTATTYHHIAYIYQDKKMYSEALEIYNLALDIREKVLGTNHISTASTYHNIGNILEDLQKYNLALKEYNKALKVEVNTLGEEHPTTVNTYHNIANVLQAKELYDESLKYYEKALTANLKNLRKNHPTISTNYHNIGISHFYKKNYKKAYLSTKKSFDIFLFNRKNNIKNLDSFEKKYFLNHNKDIMRISHLFKTAWVYKNKAVKEGLEKNILNYWLNYKGTLFEYQNILSMVKNNPKTSAKTINTINNLNLLNKKLSNNTNSIEESKIEEKIHKIEIELSKDNDKLKNMLKLNDLNSTQISKHLKPHQLYIDFAQGNNHYYLFTIDSQQHITFQQIDENQTKRINKNIKAFRANTQKMADYLQEHKLEEIREKSKKEAKEILAKLYDDIIKKYLQNQIIGKTHLIISPDGLLNYLPFEALYTQNGYLIENHKINYISSGKEFIRQTKIVSKKPKYEMVLFANADFNAKVKEYIPFQKKNEYKEVMEKNDIKEFNSLGINEIVTIQKYYPKSLIFKDENASIANLMQVPSSKILHLSTHGLFLEDENIINPMRKSILVFAGANKNKQQATISALKLSTLNLKETKLVVLSACQSGLGDIQNAEGIVGLPKALLQAGAKNVIMSLWTVSNDKTAMLMDNFYANIIKNQDYSTALQNAKIKMIKKHPYYWSAFILSGF